jgi:hypothetical protein
MTFRATEIKLNQGVGRTLVKLAILSVAKEYVKNKPKSEFGRRILDNPDWWQDRIYPLVVADIEENTDDSTITKLVKDALSLFEV